MIYKIRMETEIDTEAGQSAFSTAETIKADVVQLAILKRWAFADILRVSVEQVDDAAQIPDEAGV